VKVYGPTPKPTGGVKDDAYTVDVDGNVITVKDRAGEVISTITASPKDADKQLFRGWSHDDSVIEDISGYPIKSAVKPMYVGIHTATVNYCKEVAGKEETVTEYITFYDDSVFKLSGKTLTVEIVDPQGTSVTKTVTTAVPEGKELKWTMYGETLQDGTLSVRPGDVTISANTTSKLTFKLTITEPKAGGTVTGDLEYEVPNGKELRIYADGRTLHVLDQTGKELGTATASPSSGYTFDGWRLNKTSPISKDPSDPTVIIADSDINAVFSSGGGGGGGGGSDPEPIIEDKTYTNPDGSVTKEHKVTQRHNDGSTDIDDTKDTEFTDGGTAHENEKTRIEKDGSGHSLYEATVKDKDGNTTDHTIVERRWTPEGTIELRTVDDDFESGRLTSSTEVTMETNPLDGSTTITTSIDRYGEDGSLTETTDATMRIGADGKGTVRSDSGYYDDWGNWITERQEGTVTVGQDGSMSIDSSVSKTTDDGRRVSGTQKEIDSNDGTIISAEFELKYANTDGTTTTVTGSGNGDRMVIDVSGTRGIDVLSAMDSIHGLEPKDLMVTSKADKDGTIYTTDEAIALLALHDSGLSAVDGKNMLALDSTVVKGIHDAGGHDIRLIVIEATPEMKTEEQKDVIRAEYSAKVALLVDGVEVHTLYGGKASVDIAPGFDVAYVYYVDEQGNVEEVPSEYHKDTGVVEWTVTHLSIYMITAEKWQPHEDSDNCWIWILVIIAIVLILLLIILFVLRHKVTLDLGGSKPVSVPEGWKQPSDSQSILYRRFWHGKELEIPVVNVAGKTIISWYPDPPEKVKESETFQAVYAGENKEDIVLK
ncbi:MAG: hypothetical protein IKN41_03220, partial [Candidatus Methanomethylophilaceae archaeon]|nr:hypothetical protein [Candidatus Methanomethylophilaceae archaeon]